MGDIVKPGSYLVLLLSGILIVLLFIPLRQDKPVQNSEIRLGAIECSSTQEMCLIHYQGKEFTLEMGRPQGLKPFVVNFSSTVAELSQVSIQFEMLGMDMQQRPIPLTSIGPGLWQQQVILPLCSSGRSDWQAWIRFKYQGNDFRLEFPFIVY